MHYTVSRNIIHNTNYFSVTPEAKAILNQVKKSYYKNPHLNNFDKRYSRDHNKNTKMLNIKYIISINNYSISEYTIFILLKLSIQFIWSRFKFIKFYDN